MRTPTKDELLAFIKQADPNDEHGMLDLSDHEMSFIDSASQPDTVAVPREQLEHWAEYWNGNANEKSMTDALEHILGEIDFVLQAAQEAK